MDEEPQEPQFRVSDRRRFSLEGEPLERQQEPEVEQPPAAETEPPKAASDASREAPPEAPQEAQTGQAQAQAGVPPASFELLVVSLAMQAQIELSPPGETSESHGHTPNLELARHTIDLLGVLQEKTKGNLSLEEARLLENTLTELRFRYVQRVGEINKEAKA